MPRITVTDEPTLLTTGNAGADNRAGKGSMIKNTGSTTIEVASNNAVAFGTDFPLAAGETLPVDLGSGEAIYGVCDAGQTGEVALIEIGIA